MTRVIVVVAALGIALGALGLTAGAAQAAGQDASAPDTSEAEALPPGMKPCPQPIVARLQAALPTLARVAGCRSIAGPTRLVNGIAVAGTSFLAEVAMQDGRIAKVEATAEAVSGVVYEHDDLVGSSGKGMAVLFWIFALASVLGALFVVSRRNLIAAVMGMVGSFLGIAAIYMLLYASFLAVVQMLVYAGAIMVLFVFVVMILNRPEDEPVAPSGRIGQVLGGVAILYLVGRLIMMLVQVEPPDAAIAMAAPAATPEHYDWGSVRAVGTDLFGPGLFPFEAISILLLLAVVGAIAIARPLHTDDDAPAKTRAEGGAA